MHQGFRHAVGLGVGGNQRVIFGVTGMRGRRKGQGGNEKRYVVAPLLGSMNFPIDGMTAP